MAAQPGNTGTKPHHLISGVRPTNTIGSTRPERVGSAARKGACEVTCPSRLVQAVANPRGEPLSTTGGQNESKAPKDVLRASFDHGLTQT